MLMQDQMQSLSLFDMQKVSFLAALVQPMHFTSQPIRQLKCDVIKTTEVSN